MRNKEILSIVLSEFDEFMKSEHLKLLFKECSEMMLSLCISDGENYIYIYNSFHPYDYPYEFMICYGKHKALSSTDTKRIALGHKLPLWWFDRKYNPSLMEEDKKESVIRNGSSIAKEHFAEFKNMSIDSFNKEYEKLTNRAR